MDCVANRKDFRSSLTGWLLFALVLHLLLIRQLPPGFRFEQADVPLSSPIEVVLKHPKPLAQAPATQPEPAAPPAVLPEPTLETPAMQQQATVAPRPQPSSESTSKTAPPPEAAAQRPRIDARRLKDSIRNYRLPEQDGSKPFTRMIPSSIDAEAFSANTLVRINRRIQEYDRRAGAKVVRIRRFGKKDRCFLAHGEGVDVEREDWDPGVATLIRAVADEIPCE